MDRVAFTAAPVQRTKRRPRKTSESNRPAPIPIQKKRKRASRAVNATEGKSSTLRGGLVAVYDGMVPLPENVGSFVPFSIVGASGLGSDGAGVGSGGGGGAAAPAARVRQPLQPRAVPQPELLNPSHDSDGGAEEDKDDEVIQEQALVQEARAAVAALVVTPGVPPCAVAKARLSLDDACCAEKVVTDQARRAHQARKDLVDKWCPPTRADSTGRAVQYVSNPTGTSKRTRRVVRVFGGQMCSRCNRLMKIVPAESMLVCDSCQAVRVFMDTGPGNRSVGLDSVTNVAAPSYQPEQHLQQRMKHAEANDGASVPEAALQDVMKVMWQNKVTLDELMSPYGPTLVRRALKICSLSSLFKFVPTVLRSLTGVKPPQFPPKLRDELILMFRLAMQAYSRHRPTNRLNLINYYFILYKLCELRGHVEFLPQFTMLRTTANIANLDKIWKDICLDKDVNWEFVPTRLASLQARG